MRYVPSAAEARRSNLVTAAIVGVATPALGWLDGFTDLAWLALFGLGMAALAYGFHSWIGRSAGPAVIEVAEGALVVERRGTRTELPWGGIGSVAFGSHGGQHLVVKALAGGSPLRVSLDGHRAEDVAEMRARIAERLPAARR
ncbi:hypothetical protein [Falsiroseomonas sp. CW058]|uniref:hypothetical protein n=1 Tax=Falsiroseomonas sp. CW058 TaxID=3388664 RepID=UPI003D31222A